MDLSGLIDSLLPWIASVVTLILGVLSWHLAARRDSRDGWRVLLDEQRKELERLREKVEKLEKAKENQDRVISQLQDYADQLEIENVTMHTALSQQKQDHANQLAAIEKRVGYLELAVQERDSKIALYLQYINELLTGAKTLYQQLIDLGQNPAYGPPPEFDSITGQSSKK